VEGSSVRPLARPARADDTGVTPRAATSNAKSPAPKSPAPKSPAPKSPAPKSAAECLASALRARTLASRADWARKGLAAEDDELDPEIQFLLVRQLYLVHIEEDRLEPALAMAAQMLAIGAMRDLAQHDRARVLWARGDAREAIEAQRHAARLAPPDRRSFHTLALATLQHFAGDVPAALRTLARAERWSHRDRVLVRAYRVVVELGDDRVPEGLEEVRNALAASPLREGYGQYLLGMIAYELGDRPRATAHLRAFLRKNAAIDRAKELTLREELRRARRALAELESD
jgi:tetratricopeptide (TPR) repeat protein